MTLTQISVGAHTGGKAQAVARAGHVIIKLLLQRTALLDSQVMTCGRVVSSTNRPKAREYCVEMTGAAF